MKKLVALFIFVIWLTACAPSQSVLQTAILQTQAAWTAIPTQTPYPTQTSQPTIVITRVFVWTPTSDPNNDKCKPIIGVDYSDNSKIAIQLQAYVASLPNVKSVSYVIPERLYSNTISQLFHITYTDSTDGKLYSKRYIVYIREFGWKNAVFSIDGQCWIDIPH